MLSNTICWDEIIHKLPNDSKKNREKCPRQIQVMCITFSNSDLNENDFFAVVIVVAIG